LNILYILADLIFTVQKIARQYHKSEDSVGECPS